MVADLAVVGERVPGVVAAPLGNNRIPLKHDQARIAEAVLSIAHLGRVPETFAGSNGGKPAASMQHQPTFIVISRIVIHSRCWRNRTSEGPLHKARPACRHR